MNLLFQHTVYYYDKQYSQQPAWKKNKFHSSASPASTQYKLTLGGHNAEKLFEWVAESIYLPSFFGFC